MGKAKSYEGAGITVEFEARRCIHAAECVRGLPEVFDPERRPWIDPDRGAVEAIVETVGRCPTGALRYRRADGTDAEEPPAEATVRIVRDGPLYVSGQIELKSADGSGAETRLALCRCGASSNKPYCDNSHGEAGFADEGKLGSSDLPAADGSEPAGVRLSPLPDGPVLLEGAVTLSSQDGATASGTRAALCRCGASANKPFCDGAHKAAGFKAD